MTMAVALLHFCIFSTISHELWRRAIGPGSVQVKLQKTVFGILERS